MDESSLCRCGCDTCDGGGVIAGSLILSGSGMLGYLVFKDVAVKMI